MATTRTITTPMTLERFENLIAAYGAEPTRWPSDERAQAQEFLATSPEAQAALTDARDLDTVLDAMPQMEVSAHFRDQMAKLGENTIAAKASVYGENSTADPASTGSVWQSLTNTLTHTLWHPARKMAGIYAGAGALGLAVGIFAPVSLATNLSASNQGMTNEDIMTLAFVSPTETAVSNSFEWTE